MAHLFVVAPLILAGYGLIKNKKWDPNFLGMMGCLFFALIEIGGIIIGVRDYNIKLINLLGLIFTMFVSIFTIYLGYKLWKKNKKGKTFLQNEIKIRLILLIMIISLFSFFMFFQNIGKTITINDEYFKHYVISIVFFITAGILLIVSSLRFIEDKKYGKHISLIGLICFFISLIILAYNRLTILKFDLISMANIYAFFIFSIFVLIFILYYWKKI